MKDMITLSKGGTKERTVKVSSIVIPDLWHIAQLPELKNYSLGGKPANKMILECWHLAHDLLREIKENQSE